MERELDRLGSYHSLMIVNSALSNFLVEGFKKAWKRLSDDDMEFHQRILGMFHPSHNYVSYRKLYKIRAVNLIKNLFFGREKPDAQFLLAMPVMQRDIILAGEMPTHFEHLSSESLNWQKLRVLGEMVSTLELSRRSAMQFLSDVYAESPTDELASTLLNLAWTDDEDILYKVSKRGNKDTVNVSMASTSVEESPAKPAPPLLSKSSLNVSVVAVALIFPFLFLYSFSTLGNHAVRLSTRRTRRLSARSAAHFARRRRIRVANGRILRGWTRHDGEESTSGNDFR